MANGIGANAPRGVFGLPLGCLLQMRHFELACILAYVGHSKIEHKTGLK